VWDAIYTQLVQHAEVFAHVAAARPDDTRLWLARVRHLSSDWDRAKPVIAQMRKRWPNDLNLVAALDQLMQERRKFSDAVALYSEVLETHKNNSKLRFQRANRYSQMGEWDRAFGDYCEVQDKVSDDPRGDPSRGTVYFALASYAELFNRATVKWPKEARLWLTRANISPVREDQAARALHLKEAADRAPQNPQVLAEIGRLTLKNDRLNEAAGYFADALKHSPDAPLFADYFFQAERAIHPLHHEVARHPKLFPLVSALCKDDARLWLERVRFEFQPFLLNPPGFDHAAAAEALDNLVRLLPREPRAFGVRAYFHFTPQVRQWDKAAADLATVLDLIPAEPPWKPEQYWAVSPVFFCPDEVYAKLVKSRPVPAWAKAHRAHAQAQQGKAEAAEALLREALEQKPKDRGMLLHSARIHAGLRKWERALADLDAVRKLADFGDDSGLWFEAAAYLAAAGKKEDYRDLCARMQKQFQGSKDAVAINHVVFARLLLPGEPVPESVLERAEFVLKANPKLPANVLVAALARRRAGQADSAATLIQDFFKGNGAGMPDVHMLRMVLGMALADQKKAVAARVELIRGLAPFPGWDIPQAIQPFRSPSSTWAATELLAREAGPVLDVLLKDGAALMPSDRELLWKRANLNAAFGRWEQAAEGTAILRPLLGFGTDSFQWVVPAMYLAAGGKREEHRAYCEKMLERFRNSTDPVALNRVAMACLLVPGGVGDPKILLDLAEKALKGDQTAPWNVYTAVLARLNAGEAEAAVTLVGDYLKRGDHKRSDPQDEVVLRLVHGMALARLDKAGGARVELAAGIKAFEERFPPGKGPTRRQDPPHG
jgi:tetratricopeptide (TPR) repeat protein